MKAILMSIRPEWVAKILNGEKTIEIRKKFPKDYVGWVYIYCTKDKKIFLRDFRDKKKWAAYWKFVAMENDPSNVGELPPILNGKVVARFWCDNVEEIVCLPINGRYATETIGDSSFEKYSCLNFEQLDNYLQGKNGTAIHIPNLEVFDKPKELSEFKSYKKNIVNTKINGMVFETELDNSLIKAPQSWCYVEL